MIAPDLRTIFDIAPAVEGACKSLFAEQQPAIFGFCQREFDQAGINADTGQATRVELPAERVDIQLTLGQWTGRWAVDSAGAFYHGAWNYTLRFDVRTDAYPDDPHAHDRMVSTIRALMQVGAGNFGNDRLPYHCLVTIDEQSAAPSISVEDDQDISPMLFTGILSIRSGAIPAA